MENKLISVIVPVYKTEENHLRNAIESIIKQNYKELQIILVDDGSPDRCGSICDSYAKRDERICVIHKENGGVSSARNCGLEAATGDYIFFVDSDDILEDNAIDVLFNATQETEADISICSCKHVKGKSREIVKYENVEKCLKTVKPEEAIRNLSYNAPVYDELESTAVWGKLYKKTVIDGLRFNEKMNIAEDFIFNYFAILNSNFVTYCNLKLYNYNFVETSLMNSKAYSPKLIQSFAELVKFEKSQQNTVYVEHLQARSANIALTIYLKIPENKRKERKLVERYIQEIRKNVIKNRLVNKKVKGALIASYMGFDFVRTLFKLFDLRH